MNHITPSVLFIAALTAQAAGQTFTTPAGYDTKPGGFGTYNYALSFASPHFTSARSQGVNAEIQEPVTLRRLEWRTPLGTSPSWGVGRSFSKVTLQLGHAVEKLTTSFASNWNGAPTTVFSAAWNQPWVTMSGPPQTWGTPGSFPFSTPFAYQPPRGRLLQEWANTGGVLGTSSGTRAVPYGLDAVVPPVLRQVSPTAGPTSQNAHLPRFYQPATGPTCQDSSSPVTFIDAVADLAIEVFPDSYSNSSLAGRGRFSWSTTLATAPNSAVAAMLTLGGSDAGTAIGARCNRLHVNPAAPLAIMFRTADATGSVANWLTGTIRWRDGFAGLRIYWQAAWQDSKTRAFSLTNATRLTLPHKPAFERWNLNEHTAGQLRVGPYSEQLDNLQVIELWNRK